MIWDGDRNTRYYQISTIVRRRVNQIVTLQNDQGDWISDGEELKNMVRTFFMSLYTDDCGTYTPFLLPANKFPTLTAEETTCLNQDFASNEIKKEIFKMGAYTTPGPEVSKRYSTKKIGS